MINITKIIILSYYFKVKKSLLDEILSFIIMKLSYILFHFFILYLITYFSYFYV